MNRRSFLDAMLKGAAAFTILPSAGRIWKAERRILVDYGLFESRTFRFLPSIQDYFIQMHQEKSGNWSDHYERLVLGDWPPNKTEVTQRPILSDLNERQPVRQISTVRVRV